MPPFIRTPASRYNDIVSETAGKCSSYQLWNGGPARTRRTEADYKWCEFGRREKTRRENKPRDYFNTWITRQRWCLPHQWHVEEFQGARRLVRRKCGTFNIKHIRYIKTGIKVWHTLPRPRLPNPYSCLHVYVIKKKEKEKSVVLKERVQFFRHLGQTLRGFWCRLLSSSGSGTLLRPLWSVCLSLYVLASAQNSLALHKVLVGVAEREIGVLDLPKRLKKRTEGEKRYNGGRNRDKVRARGAAFSENLVTSSQQKNKLERFPN